MTKGVIAGATIATRRAALRRVSLRPRKSSRRSDAPDWGRLEATAWQDASSSPASGSSAG